MAAGTLDRMSVWLSMTTRSPSSSSTVGVVMAGLSGWCRGRGRNSRLLVRPCRSPGQMWATRVLAISGALAGFWPVIRAPSSTTLGSQLLAEREKLAPLAISSSSRENSR